MKDIEKIKSEDLGCQVQDANPANFAIEQEVAQLVGATVPQPTQPSADDARELGAQLLVFLRRALTPIQTALRTAVAAIYAHLDSRCTAYTPAAYAPYIPRPYDPMGTPPTPRSVANLLTAITAFFPRKISGADVADGISVVHLVSSIAAEDVKALTDDNTDWTMTSNPLRLFPNTETFQAYCKAIAFSVESNQTMFSNSHVKNLDMALVETITQTGGYQSYHAIFSLSALENVNLRKLKSYNGCLFRGGKCSEELWLDELTNAGTCIAQGVSGLKRLYAPKVTTCNGYSYHPNLIANNPDLEYAYIPELANYTVYGADDGAGSLQDMPKLEHLVIGRAPFIINSTPVRYALDNCPKLILLDIRGGLNVNLYLDHWSPTLDSSNLDQFLQNFKEHIALRLTANGSGKTLTLSQAVRNAIHAAEATYGIEAIIVTQKGWRIQPDAS